MNVVEQLHAAISALGAVEPDALSDGELDELVVGMQRERHRLAAATARCLARWEARGVWRGDGSRSPAARLARDTHASASSARADLRRARTLTDMPVTASAIEAGRLSIDHVDLFAGADTPSRHEHFERDEPLLVEQCAGLRFPDAVRVVDYWKQRVDAAGCEPDAERGVDAAFVHASTTLDGTVRIDGMLDAVGGSIVRRELDRLEHDQYLADRAAGVLRTASQRRAAALVEMATRSAATPADARRPRPLITVLVGDDRFAQLCELDTGAVLAPGQVLPHLDVADVETVLFGDDLHVLGVSSRRTFTGRLRRAIEVRGRHCEHPSGCDVPAARCDVDHITPWTHGGPTSQSNGRLECPPHNRDAAKHDHHTPPRPHRPTTYLDILRARLRWRLLHDPPDAGDGDDHPTETVA